MASREELLVVLVSLRDLQRSLSALTSRVVALVGEAELSHCVCTVVGDQVKTTCWYRAIHGHCVHKYGAEEICQLESHVGAVVPHADVGAEADHKNGVLPEVERPLRWPF